MENQQGAIQLAKAFSEDRKRRAEALESQSRKVLGYFAAFSPIEPLSAADVVPLRLMVDVRHSRQLVLQLVEVAAPGDKLCEEV